MHRVTTLKFYFLNTVSATEHDALDGLFTQLFDLHQPKLALIVSGCHPTATDATAEISYHYNNITHVNFICVCSCGHM